MRRKRLTEQELADRWQAGGMIPTYAHVLAAMDTAISRGVEDRLTDAVLRMTGHVPTRFIDFANREAKTWVKT